MNAKQPQPSIGMMRRNLILAFTITVLIGYAQWLSYRISSAGLLHAFVLFGVCVGYLGFGIGSVYAEKLSKKTFLWGYILVEMILATLIIYLGEGITWLVIFPLVSQITMILPRRESYLVNILVFIFVFLFSSVVRNGTINWELAFGVFCGMVFVILFSQIVMNEYLARREVERLNDELNIANRKLHEYAIQVDELATIRERNRLARDIHDGLGHYLTAIDMQLKAAQAILNEDETRVRDFLSKAQSLAEDALGDVRHSVSALRGSLELQQALPDAISVLVSECQEEGLVSEYTIEGDIRKIAPEAEFTIYRAAQETLTNVRKHALASRVDVLLRYDQERVVLTVSDNGVGAEHLGGGFGLMGLRERVQSLRGHVNIHTVPQQGFRVEVELPG